MKICFADSNISVQTVAETTGCQWPPSHQHLCIRIHIKFDEIEFTPVICKLFLHFFSADFHPQITQLGKDLRRPFLVFAFCKFFLHRLSSRVSHHNHATQPRYYRVFCVPSVCTALQALHMKSTMPSLLAFLRITFKLG